jgi:phosphotransferase system HPr-like phosphotransfer protein
MIDLKLTIKHFNMPWRHQVIRVHLASFLSKFISEIGVKSLGGEDYVDAKSVMDLCIAGENIESYVQEYHFKINGEDQDVVKNALLEFQEINNECIQDGEDFCWFEKYYQLFKKYHPRHQALKGLRNYIRRHY